MSKPFEWSTAMEHELMRYRGEGHSIEACADLMSIDKKLILAKAQQLGINKRMNRSCISGVKMIKLKRKQTELDLEQKRQLKLRLFG